jgi:hypothetical protein
LRVGRIVGVDLNFGRGKKLLVAKYFGRQYSRCGFEFWEREEAFGHEIFGRGLGIGTYIWRLFKNFSS